MNMFLQDHKSLIFTRIGIFSSELMPAYSELSQWKFCFVLPISIVYISFHSIKEEKVLSLP